MFRLNDPLTNVVEINETEYKLDLSFDNVLDILENNGNKALDNVSKLEIILTLLLDKDLSFNIYDSSFVDRDSETAINLDEAVRIWMETIELLGLKAKEKLDIQGNPMPAVEKNDASYDISHDAPLIYSGFMQTYGIDLLEQQGKLDYRKFIALLEGLPTDTMFKQVIDIRTRPMPTGKGSEKERANLRRMKDVYALPEKEGDTDG